MRRTCATGRRYRFPFAASLFSRACRVQRYHCSLKIRGVEAGFRLSIYKNPFLAWGNKLKLPAQLIDALPSGLGIGLVLVRFGATMYYPGAIHMGPSGCAPYFRHREGVRSIPAVSWLVAILPSFPRPSWPESIVGCPAASAALDVMRCSVYAGGLANLLAQSLCGLLPLLRFGA